MIAEVIDRSGQVLLFTGSGFTLPGRGFIRYDDIMAAEWISSEPFAVGARRKREDFDHIEFQLGDGSSVTLMDVEQAAFPLLHFFEWMIRRRKQQANQSIQRMRASRSDQLVIVETILSPQLNRNDRLRPNNGMQRTADLPSIK